MSRLPSASAPHDRSAIQVSRHDTELGISYWTKNYRTGVEAGDPLALSREYPYYDPICLLPEHGQRWRRARARGPVASGAAATELIPAH